VYVLATGISDILIEKNNTAAYTLFHNTYIYVCTYGIDVEIDLLFFDQDQLLNVCRRSHADCAFMYIILYTGRYNIIMYYIILY